jgi:hypothetical protein
MEYNIKTLWELIKGAPAFDKDYILYRFIMDDSHISHLKIGDKYTEKSFISTTRDPFYQSEDYKFGYVLVKIRLPKNKKGVGLSIETVSHFHEEQEIILPPKTQLRLIKKDKNCSYYHTDDNQEYKIRIRYEFILEKTLDITFETYPETDKSGLIDFMELGRETNLNDYDFETKIKTFVRNNVNKLYQFGSKVGEKEYVFVVEWYNSRSAYKKFYRETTENGFYMYTFFKSNVAMTLEFSPNIIHVNYYFRLSTSIIIKLYEEDELLMFLSSLAYYFKIPTMYIYIDYFSCDLEGQIKSLNDPKLQHAKKYYGGNYKIDFYEYFKSGKKRDKAIELKPAFEYFQLDKMKELSPDKIIKKKDPDELYQIYTKLYKTKGKPDNIASFYVWIIENYCYLTHILEKKMVRIYRNKNQKSKQNNPFRLDYYILDTYSYLYNRRLIPSIPPQKTNIQTTDKQQIYDLKDDDISRLMSRKNKYRLEE